MEEVISGSWRSRSIAPMKVEQAEQASRRNIEAHRKTIEEKKSGEYARITRENNELLAQATEEAKGEIEAKFQAAEKEMERLRQDRSLAGEIREKIIAILLKS
jgi:hypothetical protein